jgi:hypothetical protein
MIALIILLVIFFRQLGDGKLVASDVEATKGWERAAISTFIIVLLTELTFHLLEGPAISESSETTVSVMQRIEKRLDSAGATLSAIPKNLERVETRLHADGETLSLIPKNLGAIDTRLETAGATLSLIPKTLEGMDELLLDMRIAQPVNLSYLTAADCRLVQQALRKSQVYKGKVDGICDGATNAAAREWQIRERRTVRHQRL